MINFDLKYDLRRKPTKPYLEVEIILSLSKV